MDSEPKIITAHNLGEKRAKITYLIKEITILGATYSCDDGITEPEDLAELIESEDYPFHITISISNGGIMEAGTGTATVTISITWPFDQGDDELDTYWGQLAYEYYKEQEELGTAPEAIPSISMEIELRATQI